jgi:hypothetical protein
MQGSKRNLAKLAKIKVETLPLIWQGGARALGKVVLKVQKTVKEAFELVELAYVHTVGELVEKFDERGKPLDSGFDFGLKDLDAIFALNFLEVN